MPRLIDFSQPCFHFPSLRSTPNDSGDTLDTASNSEENECEGTSGLESYIIPGSFLAIAGDNPEGYYIVEALSEVIFYFISKV